MNIWLFLALTVAGSLLGCLGGHLIWRVFNGK